jgi:small subunit ribosomal protein S20
MANHQSSKKRIRQSEKRRLHNRFYAKTMRNAVRALRGTTDKKEAEAKLPAIHAMLDKLTKNNVIHKNKAANLKSKLTKHVNKL